MACCSLKNRYRRSNGRPVWLTLSATDNVGEADEPTPYVELVTDISARRKAEAHQLRVHGELRAAIRVRNELLSIAPHELPTPLTSLSLCNQLTRRKLGRDLDPNRLRAMTEQLCERTDPSSRELLRLVDDMLDVPRRTTDKLALVPEPCNLAALAWGGRRHALGHRTHWQPPDARVLQASTGPRGSAAHHPGFDPRGQQCAAL